jgi:hypothetical protein
MGYDYTAYFDQLLKHVDSAVSVPSHPARLDGRELQRNKCHDNVDSWVQQHPERKAVRGWLFWPANEAGRYRFMAHSVVEENGELFDITPIDENERKGLVFLKHLGTEADFEPMKTVCSDVLYPPIMMDEWREGQLTALEEEVQDL